MVIALNADHAEHGVRLPQPLQLQQLDQLARYLGVQVGSRPDADYTWDLAKTQLTVRLRLAIQKTTTVDQRSTVAAAIIIPKLLYIGRHQWPSEEMVRSFQRRIYNYVWFGQFVEGKVTGKAWLNAAAAAQPRVRGGLAVPDLKIELTAMAAVTVANWAVRSTPHNLIVGDVIAATHQTGINRIVMISPTLIMPSRTTTRIGESMWESGLRACAAIPAQMMPPDKAHMVIALNCLTYFRPTMDLVWTGRTTFMDLRPYRGAIAHRCLVVEQQLNGEFYGDWIPYLAIRTLRLYGTGAKVVNPNTRFRALCQMGVLLKDIAHWVQTPRGELQITLLTPTVTRVLQRQLGGLMRLLVLNMPGMLWKGRRDGMVRYLSAPASHVQIRRILTADLRLTQRGDSSMSAGAGDVITTHRDLERQMQAAVGHAAVVRHVVPHPRLARMACLWIAKRRWRPTAQFFKRMIMKKDVTKATRAVNRGARQWGRISPEIARGLAQLRWSDVRRVVGLTPWGEQVLIRLKHHALSTYNPVTAGFHCPHHECARTGRVDLHHVFWSCPAAQRLRGTLLDRWESAGARIRDPEQAIFSLQMPEAPQALLERIGSIAVAHGDVCAELLEGSVERALQHCWSLGAALYIHCVWRWRVAHFDEHNDTSSAHHVAGYATRLRRGHGGIVMNISPDSTSVAVLRTRRTICTALGGHWTGHPRSTGISSTIYLVLHAGVRARGEERLSGGVLVAQLDVDTGKYQVVYMGGGSTQASSRAGAAQAAQLSLIKGLQLCERNSWLPCHVAGDVEPAIRQLMARIPPKTAKPRTVYWRTRRLADAVGVRSWAAVPRDRNRAAHEMIKVAKETLQNVEWRPERVSLVSSTWSAALAAAATDIKYWWSEYGEEATGRPPADTV